MPSKRLISGVIFFFLILFLILFSSINFVKASSVGLIENSTWQSNLTNVALSSIALGDVNNDSRLDLALTGADGSGRYSKIYINNGTSLEENSTWQGNLTPIYGSGVSFTDIDNDGDLDFALVGTCYTSGNCCQHPTTGTHCAEIYINNGTSLIFNLTYSQNLTGNGGSITFGDIDDDGDLDLVICSPKFRVYINNGSSFTESIKWQENIQIALSSGIGTGKAENAIFGDYDNDEDLDLMVIGHDGGDPRNKLFENNGTTFLIQYNWQDNLIGGIIGGVYSGSIAFGDIDNDYDLDLSLNGMWISEHARIFENNKINLTENTTWSQNLIPIALSDMALGDYDNNGKLDLAWGGTDGTRLAKVYENNGATFIEDTVASENLTGIRDGSLAFGDIDNDYDLDLILTGQCAGTDCFVSRIYINNNTVANNIPQPPTGGFSGNYSSGSASFGWHNGSDTETNTSGLYYNLRVGTAANKNSVVTGIYGGSGTPAAGYFGNMMQRKNITITRDWDAGTTYYWSVQTIDTGLAKSNWSTEQTFTTPSDTGLPTITLIAPEAGYYSDNTSVLFNATVVDVNGIANVSIWADFDGTFKLNETNSSGKNDTSYVFKRNLSQGTYQWKYQAYDNSSSFNSVNSSTRILNVDLYAPRVALISPANSSSWTTSSTVTFSYNVTDLAIVNCSLIIDGAIDQTNASIQINTTQTFSKILVNANYNWSVNCTDNVNRRNNSGTFELTVSYTAPAGNGGNGGGGGGAATPIENITNVTEVSEEIEEPQEEEPEEEKEGIEKIIKEVAGFFEKTWIYLVIVGGVALVVVAYLVYIRKFVRWGRKEKRINWKPKKRWFEL